MTASRTDKPVAADAASLLARARNVTASDTWDLDRRFPIVMERATGSHVYDAAGSEYIDFTSCSGAAPLGAGHPGVLEQTINEMRRSGGILPGPISTYRVYVAERLAEIFPCAERSIFFRTGSCATTAAARLARIATGRRVLLTSGFHGWHDWHLQYRPQLALANRDPETFDFGYDLGVLNDLAAKHGGVAAVIVTPEVSVYPHEFAREVEAVCRRHGALLVVDEVMTGFRYAWGGYSKAAGIEPDVITLSKGLANGMALSCVSGRGDILKAAERTYLGNTFQRETTPFAAAMATLDAYADGDVLDRIHAAGSRLMAGLDDLFRSAGVDAWTAGVPTMFDMVFADPSLGTSFCQRMWAAGFLMQYGGRFMPSSAVTEEDIESALAAAPPALASAMTDHAVAVGEPGGRDDSGFLAALVEFGREAFASTPDSVRAWARRGQPR